MKIAIERTGSLVRGSVTAPAGKVWAASGTHEMVSESRGGKEATADVRADLKDRMRYGVHDCDDPDCAWCEDGGAE